MFGGAGGVRANGRLEFANRRRVIALGHVGPGQTIVTAVPAWVLPRELLKLGNRAVEIVLIAIRVPKIVADARLLRVESFGGPIFGDRIFQSPKIVQDYTQITVRFPKIRTQTESVPIRNSGATQIALIAQRDSHVVVHVGVGRFTGE